MKLNKLTGHPELYRLLRKDELLAEILKLSPRTSWCAVNYHLKNADSPGVAMNLTKNLSDFEMPTIVLKQIAPEYCTLAPDRPLAAHRGNDSGDRQNGLLEVWVSAKSRAVGTGLKTRLWN
jgi:hypothetical protein